MVLEFIKIITTVVHLKVLLEQCFFDELSKLLELPVGDFTTQFIDDSHL